MHQHFGGKRAYCSCRKFIDRNVAVILLIFLLIGTACADVGWDDFKVYKEATYGYVIFHIECLEHPEHRGDHYDLRFLNSTNRSLGEYKDNVFSFEQPTIRNLSYSMPRQETITLCIKSSLSGTYKDTCRVVWTEGVDGPKTIGGAGLVVSSSEEGFSVGGVWVWLKPVLWLMASAGGWYFWYIKLRRGAIRPKYVAAAWLVFSGVYWLMLP